MAFVGMYKMERNLRQRIQIKYRQLRLLNLIGSFPVRKKFVIIHNSLELLYIKN